MEEATVVALICGGVLGFLCGLTLNLSSFTDDQPASIYTRSYVTYQCKHPFAKCKCGEQFFLLHRDLMFAPDQCPNCKAAKDTFVIEDHTYREEVWNPAQREPKVKQA